MATWKLKPTVLDLFLFKMYHYICMFADLKARSPHKAGHNDHKSRGSIHSTLFSRQFLLEQITALERAECGLHACDCLAVHMVQFH